MKQFFLKLALLISMGCAPIYADEYCPEYSSSYSLFLNPGWSLGTYGTFQTVFFNTRDRITASGDGDIYLWRFDSVQKAPGGGVFISYDLGGCDCFAPSIRWDGIILADTSEHHLRDSSVSDNLLHQASLKWASDLTCQAGFAVGDCMFGYLRGGVTVGSIREKSWIRNEDEPWEVEDTTTVDHNSGGYVLASGVHYDLGCGINLFTEVNWREYVSRFSSLQVVALSSGQGDDNSIDTKITNAHALGLSFGLAAKF